MAFFRLQKTSLILACVILMMPSADSKQFHSVMGPFTVKVKRLEQCPKELQGNKDKSLDYYFRDTRTSHNQEQSYSGNISLPIVFSDDLGARLRIASWSSMGGWKDNAHILKMDHICKTLVTVAPPLWMSFTFSVFGEEPPCPYLPGVYRFQNFTLDFRQLGIRQFLYGRWRCDAQIFVTKTGETAACLRAFADTVPI